MCQFYKFFTFNIILPTELMVHLSINNQNGLKLEHVEIRIIINYLLKW